MAGTVAGCRDQGDFIAEPGVAWRPNRPCRLPRLASRSREIPPSIRLRAVSRQTSYSVLPTYITALAKVVPIGRRQACVPADVVLHANGCKAPCRCCQAGKPVTAVHGFRRKGLFRYDSKIDTLRPSCHCQRPCVPSLTIRREGVSTTSEWIDILRRPSAVAKSGMSHGNFRISSMAGLRQDKSCAADRLQLDDPGDSDLAHSPVHSGVFPLLIALRAARIGGAGAFALIYSVPGNAPPSSTMFCPVNESGLGRAQKRAEPRRIPRARRSGRRD